MEKKFTTIKRIALIGPECSAKSTLSENLANHYNTLWVKEYAREYLSTIDRNYKLDDILHIAQHQLLQEKELLKKAFAYLFVDTELIIAKVWCEDVFKTCPKWILENIIPTKYDFYLLTYPDLPWESDRLRENPHRRNYLFDLYENELSAISANYKIIRGVGKSRIENCIAAIAEFEKQAQTNNTE